MIVDSERGEEERKSKWCAAGLAFALLSLTLSFFRSPVVGSGKRGASRMGYGADEGSLSSGSGDGQLLLVTCGMVLLVLILYLVYRPALFIYVQIGLASSRRSMSVLTAEEPHLLHFHALPTSFMHFGGVDLDDNMFLARGLLWIPCQAHLLFRPLLSHHLVS